ncbi:MAG: protein kinase domain-containing protein [Planctomycetota bacterium]|jgi:serine/threonine protein kinase/tetratricopeptide (TPR) repeat protein
MSQDSEIPDDPDAMPTLSPDAESARGDTPFDPEGQKRLGPYQILGEIGRGGMGVVYKAFHPQLKRTVALKVLIAGEDASEEAIARFHREAEAVAKLGHHPNIVPVYDVGQVVGAFRETPLHYIAMHFVEGKSLDRMIDDGEITPKQAVIVTEKLAEALHHAHVHGILHRDVKPANVLMALPRLEGEPPGEPKGEIPNLNDTGSVRSGRAGGASGESGSEPMLTDFGLAKDVESESKMTHSGMTLGTPQYMPPEQADGRLRDIDARSDVYSLGATFYEMLALHPPFEGSAVLEVIHKVLLKDPASPRRSNPAVERDAETICLKCLEKDPGKRYGSARELAEDLGRLLDGIPILAKPASPWEKLVKRAKRNKAAAVAIIALGVVLCAGAVAGFAGLERLSRESRNRRIAERDRAIVEVRRAKSQRASRVLLGALQGLGRIGRELKRSWYDSTKSPAEKMKVYDERRDAIEAFCRNLPSDPASRSTMLAVKGWLLWHGGYEEEAVSAFREGGELDTDLPWAPFLEALTWISKYISERRLPSVTISGGKFTFGEMPPEGASSREAREKFEDRVGRAFSAPLWGESSVGEIRAVFSWLKENRRGDTEEAEAAVTRGLVLPELGWIREELLLLRAKVRYMRLDFPGGHADVDEVLKELPECVSAWCIRGMLFHGAGTQGLPEGGESGEYFRKAVQAFTQALAKKPDLAKAHNGRGIAHEALGNLRASFGENPDDDFAKAIADYSEAIRKDPELFIAYTNRGNVYRHWGSWRASQGEDPLPMDRKAIGEYERALQKSPEHLPSLQCRADMYLIIAEWRKLKGEGAFEDFREAERGYNTILQFRPASAAFLFPRGNARLGMARARARRGEDPRETFRTAIADYTSALREDPGHLEARTNRGVALHALADALARLGKDPRETLRESIRDYTAVLEKDPDFVNAYINRGSVRLTLAEAERVRGGDPEAPIRQALSDHDEVLRREPGSAVALAGNGLAWLRMGQWEAARGHDTEKCVDKAIQAYTEALRADPDHALAYDGRGVAYVRRGRIQDARREDPRESFRKAIAEFSECLKRNPGRSQTHFNRGNAFTLLGHARNTRGEDPRETFRKAEAEFSEAVRADPGYLAARVQRGQVRVALADAEVKRGGDPREGYFLAIEDYKSPRRESPGGVR